LKSKAAATEAGSGGFLHEQLAGLEAPSRSRKFTTETPSTAESRCIFRIVQRYSAFQPPIIMQTSHSKNPAAAAPVTNCPEANESIRRKCRAGWTLNG
jgi:hypothetical protein